MSDSSKEADLLAIETEPNNNQLPDIRQANGIHNGIQNGTHNNCEKPPKLEPQPLDLAADELEFNFRNIFKQILNLNGCQTPTRFTSIFCVYLIATICMIILFVDVILAFYLPELIAGHCGAIAVLVVSFSVLLFATFSLSVQPRNSKPISFQVPCVPVVPLFSVLINLYLMLNLSTATWLRFLIWMAFGLSIYFFYGISNSNERYRNKPLQLIMNGKQANGNQPIEKQPIVKQSV